MAKVTKGSAWTASLIVICLLYAVTYATGMRGHYEATLTAIVSLTALFFVGNVADNGVKGKFYNKELTGEK